MRKFFGTPKGIALAVIAIILMALYGPDTAVYLWHHQWDALKTFGKIILFYIIPIFFISFYGKKIWEWIEHSVRSLATMFGRWAARFANVQSRVIAWFGRLWHGRPTVKIIATERVDEEAASKISPETQLVAEKEQKLLTTEKRTFLDTLGMTDVEKAELKRREDEAKTIEIETKHKTPWLIAKLCATLFILLLALTIQAIFLGLMWYQFVIVQLSQGREGFVRYAIVTVFTVGLIAMIRVIGNSVKNAVTDLFLLKPSDYVKGKAHWIHPWYKLLGKIVGGGLFYVTIMAFELRLWSYRMHELVEMLGKGMHPMEKRKLDGSLNDLRPFMIFFSLLTMLFLAFYTPRHKVFLVAIMRRLNAGMLDGMGPGVTRRARTAMYKVWYAGYSKVRSVMYFICYIIPSSVGVFVVILLMTLGGSACAILHKVIAHGGDVIASLIHWVLYPFNSPWQYLLTKIEKKREHGQELNWWEYMIYQMNGSEDSDRMDDDKKGPPPSGTPSNGKNGAAVTSSTANGALVQYRAFKPTNGC